MIGFGQAGVGNGQGPQVLKTPAPVPAMAPMAPIPAAPVISNGPPIAPMMSPPDASPPAPVMPTAPVAPAAPVVPAAAQLPATPFTPAPPIMPAAPQVAANAGGKAKGAAQPAPSTKGKFRETMWFKKGELDAAAAEAAAKAPKTPDALPVSDKADELPVEDRYKDDGSITAKDRERLSLRTGATQMMPAVQVAEPKAKAERMDESEIVKEMSGGRGKIILLVFVAIAVIAGLVVWQATKDDAPSKPVPTTTK
jgi:hypothetical protein